MPSYTNNRRAPARRNATKPLPGLQRVSHERDVRLAHLEAILYDVSATSDRITERLDRLEAELLPRPYMSDPGLLEFGARGRQRSVTRAAIGRRARAYTSVSRTSSGVQRISSERGRGITSGWSRRASPCWTWAADAASSRPDARAWDRGARYRPAPRDDSARTDEGQTTSRSLRRMPTWKLSPMLRSEPCSRPSDRAPLIR